ncbi:TonB-dependent receptor [Stenotrophomonas sp. ESTM1D_MKCIP4_1]|uniref:TonB-dependent receptor n=1 Tax=Stenotrophomonas sp. ESTM1D_MKCIP4_1 TaxID=2072414 RepID=UPI00131F364D|nr:TonB-dependent receptor [Stenotrophomonas sp. ESTM1D_MKCIP4_1]
MNSNRLRVSLLAAALVATPVFAQTAADAPAAVPATAAPLGNALSSFAAERGVALSFDPALTRGRQAAPAAAGLDVDAGFAALLQGSGLRAVRRADGSYTLQAAPAPASTVRQMRPLRVGSVASRDFLYAEGMTLDQDYLQGYAKGNGDLGSLLRINPAVQFSNTGWSARNGGEIRPVDFSINGAPFYQNLFLIDGANFNNDLDPASNAAPGHNGDAYSTINVPSAAQGITVDPDLLEKVTIYDSNVPAAYGGFTGGVIDATSRTAGESLSGKVWFRMARSAWNELIMNPGQAENYEESAQPSFQQEYDKYKLGARLEGRTRNGIGLIGTVTRTRSEIPLRAYSAGKVSPTDDFKRTQVRETTAASLAADWNNGEGLQLRANVSYSPTDDTYFVVNTRNAWFNLKSGGPVVSLRADYDTGTWSFGNALTYSDLESSRSSDYDYYKLWARSEEKDWGVNTYSQEGSWGNVDQHDRKIGYRFSASRERFQWGATEHHLTFGAGVQRRDAAYERLNDHYNYQAPTATTSCMLSTGVEDTDSCSLSPVFTRTSALVAGQGQYFSKLVLYHAGAFKVSGTEWDAYLQDDIRIGNFSLRPGVRLDRNDFWKGTTLSPRFAASWDIGGTGNSVLSVGRNRYYGRNFFTYLLSEGREALQEERNRTSSATPWDSIVGTRATTANRLADLDTPYTDEWSVAWRQQFAGLDINVKYVDRRNRGDIVRKRITDSYDTTVYKTALYEYANAGRSSSGTYTLSVSPQEPLTVWGTRSTAQLALDHTESRRSYNTYEDATTATLIGDFYELVSYHGNAIHRYDLPARDYVRPWSARLATRTEIPAAGLTWSNFFSFRAGYEGLLKTSQYEQHGDDLLVVYEDVRNPSGWTWDTTLQYAFAVRANQEAYVRVEVQNVLNRSNRITGTAPTTTYYEPGRSYWLELGYSF